MYLVSVDAKDRSLVFLKLYTELGMLITRLKKYWIAKSETPNLSFNYPKLHLGRRVGRFNISLDHFGFCDPRLFKSGDYLNLMTFSNLLFEEEKKDAYLSAFLL